jgi:hypothetical protein
MKGILFTQFLEFVERRFGLEVADSILTGTTLPLGGIYTSVGTYDHRELVTLLISLHQATGVAVPELVREYGRALFRVLARGYPQLLSGAGDLFTLLERVEGTIHVEVRKLYPDTELPTLHATRSADGEMTVVYRSERGFADLAQGLIEGAARHFDAAIELRRDELGDRPGTHARFVVRQKVAVTA